MPLSVPLWTAALVVAVISCSNSSCKSSADFSSLSQEEKWTYSYLKTYLLLLQTVKVVGLTISQWCSQSRCWPTSGVKDFIYSTIYNKFDVFYDILNYVFCSLTLERNKLWWKLVCTWPVCQPRLLHYFPPLGSNLVAPAKAQGAPRAARRHCTNIKLKWTTTQSWTCRPARVEHQWFERSRQFKTVELSPSSLTSNLPSSQDWGSEERKKATCESLAEYPAKSKWENPGA